ncbi:TetR/AcrR family transcriptional regulator [Kineococcus sp. SYSU DK005]|uniref:TetR/AcrR family transcriptional regulator n=1 Tax=Kineococcus sp. SYSU DK005 TaxID=3383126 RepID=UPI003D7EE0E4
MEQSPGRSATPKGVRERTKDAIRSELSAAAMRSFQEVGYSGTTVEAIAASVGVSGRTFFRYFASKEDAVLQPIENLGRDAAVRLLDRPARETPLQALRAAMDVAVEAVLRDVPLMRTVMRLNVENPELRRRHLQRMDEWIDQLAHALALRQGLTPTDPSARLPCSIVLSAWELALHRCAQRDEFEGVSEALDAALSEAKGFLRR